MKRLHYLVSSILCLVPTIGTAAVASPTVPGTSSGEHVILTSDKAKKDAATRAKGEATLKAAKQDKADHPKAKPATVAPVTLPIPPIVYGTPLSWPALPPFLGTVVYSHPPGTILPAGRVLLSATFTSTSPHLPIIVVRFDLQVQAAPLLVSFAPASRLYRSADPAFVPTYSGFVLGEGPANLSGSLVATSAASVASPVGSYAVLGSGLTACNYQIAFAPGTLSILPRSLNVLVPDQAVDAGVPFPAFAWSLTGFLAGEDASVVGGLPAFVTAATPSSPIGVYPLVATAGTLSATNYVISGNGEATLLVLDGAGRFVQGLYQQALGHGPDAAFFTWVDTAHHSAVDAVHGIFGSPECAARQLDDAAFVAAMYQGLFGRPVDLVGNAGSQGWLAAGRLRYDVLDEHLFASNGEFAARCAALGIPVHDAKDVRRHAIRGVVRAHWWGGRRSYGTEVIFADLVEHLANGSADLSDLAAAAFAHDSEAWTYAPDRFVGETWQAVFGRWPESEAMSSWSPQIAAGLERCHFVKVLVASDEAASRCAALGLIACDDDWRVEVRLRDFVRTSFWWGRGSFPNLVTWGDDLASGGSTGRDLAETAFLAGSPASTDADFTIGVYVALLNRWPESAAVDHWTTAFASGVPRAELISQVVASEEFAGVCARFGILPYPPGG